MTVPPDWGYCRVLRWEGSDTPLEAIEYVVDGPAGLVSSVPDRASLKSDGSKIGAELEFNAFFFFRLNIPALLLASFESTVDSSTLLDLDPFLMRRNGIFGLKSVY